MEFDVERAVEIMKNGGQIICQKEADASRIRGILGMPVMVNPLLPEGSVAIMRLPAPPPLVSPRLFCESDHLDLASSLVARYCYPLSNLRPLALSVSPEWPEPESLWRILRRKGLLRAYRNMSLRRKIEFRKAPARGGKDEG